MRHSFKDWLDATRYWALPVSVMPITVAFAYLFSIHSVSGFGAWLNFVLAIIGVALLHSAGNVLSDWFDYRSGVDNAEAFAVPNLVEHRFEPREYLIFSLLLFAAGCGVGILLTFRSGLMLLAIGGAGVLLTAGYSFLKYHALGDLDIFVIFSVLIMLGAAYVVTGRICPDVLSLALPVGIITVSVLHANNTVDIVSDSKAGIKTFAMIIGARASVTLYRIYMVVPFVAIIAAVAAGFVHTICLVPVAAAVPQALRNWRAAGHFDTLGAATLAGLDRASSALQLKFSGLLTLGLLVSAALQ